MTCPVCIRGPRGPLCEEHRHDLARILRGLRTGMYELRAVADRKVRLGGGGGGARPAFAPTPMDLSAADLYDQVEDVIQDVAGDIGLWGGRAQKLLRELTNRQGRLWDAPNSGRDYRDLADALRQVSERLSTPGERIVYGHCLNPACKTALSGAPGEPTVVCPECGSTWSVKALTEARRRRFEGRTITGTPARIASWVKANAGVPVKGQDVRNWLRRGRLGRSRKVGRGVYECDLSELLDCAQGVHPGPKRLS